MRWPSERARWFRKSAGAIGLACILTVASIGARQADVEPASLAGRWTFNTTRSQPSREVGFGMDLISGPGSTADRGGRGGGGGAGLASAASFRESEEEARRRTLLVEEIRNPSSHLTIVQAADAITIADDQGRTRVLHPGGAEELQTVGNVPVVSTTRWDGSSLEVLYRVERNREIRYVYTRSANPPQLIVRVRLVERGGRDEVTLVYDPTRADEVAPPPRAAQPAAPSGAQGVPAGTASPAGPVLPRGLEPPARTAPQIGAAPAPDEELKGLTSLGVVVEDLGPKASACGLSQEPIESAVSKSLADAGLKVRRNADEDTYVYVHIMTTTVGSGLCVSRYDTFLYSYATTTLSYQAKPLLLQVSLLHKGGIAGGPAGTLGDSIVKNIKQDVDGFAGRIRAANR